MPARFRLRDASGNIIIDYGMRLGRILGVATLTGGSAGSAGNAGLATGTPFWQVTSITSPLSVQPAISVAGTTISWAWPEGGGGSWRLVYGVY